MEKIANRRAYLRTAAFLFIASLLGTFAAPPLASAGLEQDMLHIGKVLENTFTGGPKKCEPEKGKTKNCEVKHNGASHSGATNGQT